MNFAWFEKIAPHLAANPLVLVGFIMLLAYGIHWQLMKSGLLSKVDKKDSGLIIRLFLRYGFWLALTLLLAGVGLSAWNSYMDKEKVQIQAVDAGKVAEKLLAPLQAKDEQIKALTEAITALSKTGAPAASINTALQELEKGNTAKAQAIFAEVLKTKEAEGQQANKEAAAAARHLGALAFMNNPKEALLAYQKAVQLAPDDADSWNQFGHSLRRTGNITRAEEAYRNMLALDEIYQDKKGLAAAYVNLGLVYKIRGELDKAEEMYNKSLKITEFLGSKKGMATCYINLGEVYRIRSKLKKAEEMYRKSLAFYEALDSKEGVALNYAGLGIVYSTRGDLDKAEEMHKKSLEIVEALGGKEGMAHNYNNLGLIYERRGDLDKAEEMYKKSITFNEALGNKEGIAINYANIGNVHGKRGDLNQTEALWKKSLSLYKEMGHRNAKILQQALDKLAQQKAGGVQ